jgi:NAD(P)H-dependent flavin oxidoreductase YrpB (nitropropane dioxygenase family)
MSKLPKPLDHLPFPVIGSPLFIISNPKLVIAQCIAGVVGSMPSLNARPAEQLEEWLIEITEALAAYNAANPQHPAAPFAINQIVHKSNDRLEHDMAMCVKYKVPIIITSLGAREDINQAAHSYGGVVLHDIINNKHARKAIEKGADGLIAVAAGAGGHAGVKRCWLHKPWGLTLLTSVPPLSRPTKPVPQKPTSRRLLTRILMILFTATCSRGFMATTWHPAFAMQGLIPTTFR